MNWLRILTQRVWIGLLRIERSMRLDAMLTTYAASPERLTAEFVREVLADVDTDIARAEARIETLRPRRPVAQPQPWPGTFELPRRRERRALFSLIVSILAVIMSVLVLCSINERKAPAAPDTARPTVWRQV